MEFLEVPGPFGEQVPLVQLLQTQQGLLEAMKAETGYRHWVFQPWIPSVEAPVGPEKPSPLTTAGSMLLKIEVFGWYCNEWSCLCFRRV